MVEFPTNVFASAMLDTVISYLLVAVLKTPAQVADILPPVEFTFWKQFVRRFGRSIFTSDGICSFIRPF